MNKNKLSMVLHESAGIMFIVAAFIGKNFVFILIGICLIALGITNYRKRN